MDPHVLGLLQLRADPQFRRIELGRHDALVEAALGDGRFLARRVSVSYGSDPALIAARCDVPIIDSEGDAGFGSTVVFAAYSSRPASITLYGPAIRSVDREISGNDLVACLGVTESRSIFLAHELYHHFDRTRAQPLNRRHRVRIFGIGSRAWTSGLTSLAEIAAGAFAQELLGLSFHPKLLDHLLTHPSCRSG